MIVNASVLLSGRKLSPGGYYLHVHVHALFNVQWAFCDISSFSIFFFIS